MSSDSFGPCWVAQMADRTKRQLGDTEAPVGNKEEEEEKEETEEDWGKPSGPLLNLYD